GLAIEMVGFPTGATEGQIALQGVGRKLPDLADAWTQFLAVFVPVEHDVSPGYCRASQPRKAAIAWATCVSRSNATPIRWSAAASAARSSSRKVACPTLRPARGSLP